jgi:FkbM family methyltransferase
MRTFLPAEEAIGARACLCYFAPSAFRDIGAPARAIAPLSPTSGDPGVDIRHRRLLWGADRMMKSAIRKQLAVWLDRRGYLLVDRSHVDRTAHAKFIGDLFSQVQPDLVVDVGAHIGEFREFIRNEIGYQGDGISFEPVAEYFDQLSCCCRDDQRWSARQVALGAKNDVLHMNVMGQFSSICAPSTHETRVFEVENRVHRIIEVPVRTLDAEVPTDYRRVFLKVDAQGYDLAVLSGGESVLDRVCAIQIEVAFTPIYDGQPKAIESIAYLERRGFVPAGIYRVNLGGYPMRLIDADAVFVNRSYAT